MSGPSRRELARKVYDRLRGSWLTVYFGEIHGTVPTLITGGKPDPSGRVRSYAVVYPGAGTPNGDVDLGDSSADLDWSVQVTVAAGFTDDVLDAADFVHDRLHRWRPTGLTGVHADGLIPPPGFDPGPVRVDRDLKPHRFWLPLQYRLTATT
ncbi:hypothetical protein [Nocardioides lijunqiniae]|uniref:hypothetical protein n=1 Tax=Nocardioides lijunqiniae TaxID=2760832 RepID=UPI0018775940|nr:hypothetical protein [Nocardioides lijunqiniae]